MTEHLILTLISDDRPGVVESLSRVIQAGDGNWMASQMAHLAGKFAGIVEIGIAAEKSDDLITSLKNLNREGLTLLVEKSAPAPAPATTPDNTRHFTIFGNDRPGIIREVTQAFARRHINLETLNSNCTSMPHVGTPLFEAAGIVTLPPDLDTDDLEDQLDTISNELAVDIQLDQPVTE